MTYSIPNLYAGEGGFGPSFSMGLTGNVLVYRIVGMRRLVLVMGDHHAGSVVGLMNPGTVLLRAGEDGEIEEWVPDLSETQKLLWGVYIENLRYVWDMAGDDGVVVLHTGDLTQGDRVGRLVPETTLEDQRVMARYNLRPVISMPQVEAVHLITGTSVHVPESAEARIAHALRVEFEKDVKSFHHSILSVDGVVFDVAHHGPGPGYRDWLNGNTALYYLKDRIYRDRRHRGAPSRVYLRGHYHDYVHVPHHEQWGGEHEYFDIVVVPSFSGISSYARKVTRSVPYLTTGMVVFEIIDGKLQDIHPITQTWDLRVEVEI